MKDQPGTSQTLSGWSAIGGCAVLAVILLGFVAGVVALIKWV